MLMVAALTGMLGVVGVVGVVATADGLFVVTALVFMGKEFVRTGNCTVLSGRVLAGALEVVGEAAAGTMALAVGAAEAFKTTGVAADVVTTGASVLEDVTANDAG